MSGFNLVPYRCRVCSCRFYRPPGLTIAPGGEYAEVPGHTEAVDRQPAAAGGAEQEVNWRFPWRLLGIVILIAAAALAGVYYLPSAWSGMQEKAAVREFVFEHNINRPGDDYTHFAVRNPRPEACAAECAKDTNCIAFTYTPPPVPGASAHCWLKSGLPFPVRDTCCISGVKAR